MQPINYMTQGIDPVARALEGYNQGLGVVGARQQMQMNDQNMATQLAELELSGRRVDQADRSLDQADQRLGMQQAQMNAQMAMQAEAQARAESLRNDLSALIENDQATAQDYQQLAARHPEFAQQIMAPFENISEQRKERDLLQLAQIHTAIETDNIDVARELLQTRRDAVANAGMEQDAVAADAMLKYLDIDPRMARAMTGTALSVLGGDRFNSVLNAGREEPAQIQALRLQAEAAGLVEGTPEYKEFMLNGGAAPAAFRSLDMQAQAAGLTPGTEEYAEFMATRGAGQQAYAKTTAENIADTETGREAEFERGRGRAQGTASVESDRELAEMERNMPGLRVVVDQLYDLSNTATYTQAGQLRDAARKALGLPAGEGAVARAEYIAVVDNQVLPLLRQTFGAAFTAKEGETLRNTLGDPDKSPEEKRAVLRAFIAQKERDLAARQGSSQGAAPQATGGDELDALLLEFQQMEFQ